MGWRRAGTAVYFPQQLAFSEIGPMAGPGLLRVKVHHRPLLGRPLSLKSKC